MDQICDKAILLFCGLALTLITTFDIIPVILFLCTLILLSIDELLPDRFPKAPVFILLNLISLFVPEMMFFLPALAYSVILKKRSPVVLIFLLPYLFQASDLLFSGEYVLLLLVFLLALMLSDRQRRNVDLKNSLNHQRDDDREKQMLLIKQTHALKENQDNRIQIATLQERTRIAREIHDNVGHLLSRSLLQVGALQTVYKDQPALSSLRESLDLAMNGIRSSVHNLRDEAIDLKNSTQLLLDSYNGYHTFFTYEVTGTVSPQITYCFLAILKEALTNITKHSNGDSIRVSIKEFSALYQLMISDNGTSAKAPEDTGGMGLDNMRARVDSLKGVLRFSVSDGFHIFVSVPK